MAYVLQQLLKKSAKAYPEKPAVWARGKSITYRELDERSNQLAHFLVEKGINKGDRVGLFFPKCVESIISSRICSVTCRRNNVFGRTIHCVWCVR